MQARLYYIPKLYTRYMGLFIVHAVGFEAAIADVVVVVVVVA